MWRSATQANLVALNFLYSGTTPANGICNNLVGNGASATVMWAYNTGATPISSSPTLSMDGTKVAFVSNSSPAVFHVLAWTAGQGTVTAPVTPTGTQMNSVTLNGSTGASISSPYVDYSRDLAYVGSDNGILYVISGVFGGTPTLTASYTVSAGQRLSAPVWVDVPYSRIFVGAADGKLYSISSTTPTVIAQVNEPGGASSIIVDNISTQAQASSIYFSTLGPSSNCGNKYCAVKLTQTALQ